MEVGILLSAFGPPSLGHIYFTVSGGCEAFLDLYLGTVEHQSNFPVSVQSGSYHLIILSQHRMAIGCPTRLRVVCASHPFQLFQRLNVLGLAGVIS